MLRDSEGDSVPEKPPRPDTGPGSFYTRCVGFGVGGFKGKGETSVLILKFY